jgi:predicted alpha/beta hydrolase family esterase
LEVIILHGIGGHAGIHWQQWLSDELEKVGCKVAMPNLPNPDHPDRLAWLEAAENVVKDVPPENLIIVGHSLGVTTALDLVEVDNKSAFGLACVSGFAEDYGAELNSYFLSERTVDFEIINARVKNAAVFYGDNDPYVTQSALANLSKGLKVEPFIVPSGGHLNSYAGFIEFPKLLESIKSWL